MRESVCKLSLRYLDNKTRENEIKCNEQFFMQFKGLGLNVFLMPSLVYMCWCRERVCMREREGAKVVAKIF
jgi:hypothetical protein